ncbi:divalent cation tolerance protein CutA [Clostridium botulinum]|uniref:divalent cation tolerance protein CutA n=1 Tax=Clostridium botulinum TaxID=1491 RepID=UPI000D13AEB2|nr:divalent cation tolerance protein CutA [Clostridium botulinum]AVQ45446.1 cytochrome C biogenesis protein [Clostridium botulinum]AVQ49280.1 cytochrome C biogenesis protein [Clostridium botulinum]
MKFDFFKIETFIPEEYIKELRKALNHIGALTVGGNYDNCMAVSKVKGFWRALEGSDPFNGQIGEICEAEEYKVEFCCTKEVLENTITTIKKVHPYEIPVINIIPILNSFE